MSAFLQSPEWWSSFNFWLRILIALLGLCLVFSSWRQEGLRAKAQRKAQDATQVDIKDAKEHAVLAFQRSESAENLLKPRVLTPQQHETIVNNLRSMTGQEIQVSYFELSTEAISFSKQIEAALKEAGWQISEHTRVGGVDLDSFILVMFSDKAGQLAANKLSETLNSVGIKTEVNLVTSFLPPQAPLHPGAVGLFVSRKP